jgi:ribosome modulation factor
MKEYNEGYKAFQGRAIGEIILCPYDPTTEPYKAEDWQDGWDDAAIELADII